MSEQETKEITEEQVQSVTELLKVGSIIADPVGVKQKTLVLNYLVILLPPLFAVLKAFGVINITLTAEQVSIAWQFGLVFFGLISNVVLAITSRSINLNPFNRTRMRSMASDDES